MAEWFIVAVLKTVGGEIHPRVRIPPLPPFFIYKEKTMENYSNLLLLVGGFVTLVLLFKSYVSVPEGRQRLILRWGKYRCTLAAGWHFILPWIDNADREIDVTIKTTPETELLVTTSDNAKVPIHYSISYRVIDGYRACYKTENYDEFVWGELKSAIVQHLGTISHADLKRIPKSQADEIKKAAQAGLDRVGVELANINFSHVGEDPAALADTRFKAQEESQAQETRAVSEKKVTKLQSEERAEAIKVVSAAEADQLNKFTEIFGDADRAASYLLGIRKIEALRRVATSSNAKVIITDGESNLSPVMDVNNLGNEGAAKSVQS